MVRSLKAQAAQATALPFLITAWTPGFREPVIVGQLTVSSIVWGSAMMATLGYWVDKDRAGHGIAPTAVALATDYCFQTLGLHRMEINIRPENGPSLRVVEKLGFRDEGYRPRFLHINGEWADHRSFALTSEEVPGRAPGTLAVEPPGVSGHTLPDLRFVLNRSHLSLAHATHRGQCGPVTPDCSYGFDCGLPS